MTKTMEFDFCNIMVRWIWERTEKVSNNSVQRGVRECIVIIFYFPKIFKYNKLTWIDVEETNMSILMRGYQHGECGMTNNLINWRIISNTCREKNHLFSSYTFLTS